MFCIAEEDTEADELKTDVKKFLYDLRMQAEVIVVTMKSWEAHQADSQATGETGRNDAMEAFSKARKRVAQGSAEILKKAGGSTGSTSGQSETEQNLFDEQQVTINYLSYLLSFCPCASNFYEQFHHWT